MRSLKFVRLFSLALFLAGLASANRLDTDDSTYGSVFLHSQWSCLDATGATLSGPSSTKPTCGSTAALLEQTFMASSRDGAEVFDFNIIENAPNITSFRLTLTGDAPFVSDNGSQWGYGALACGTTSEEQCGPNPGLHGVTNNPDVSDTPTGFTSVVFTGPGNGNGFVFFGVEDETLAPSLVHAELELVSTPEPGSWLLLASGILILFALRGRLTRLLKPSSLGRN